MVNSTFCMAPEGKHPNSQRPFEVNGSRLHPRHSDRPDELPFEDILDWRQFSIKVPEARVADIMTILRSVPPVRLPTCLPCMDWEQLP